MRPEGIVGGVATLRLFASAREAAGTSRDTVPGSTVAEVLHAATQRYGHGFAALLETCKVWVNGDEATPDHDADQAAPGRTVGDGDGMKGAYLGPEFARDDIAARLTAAGAKFRTLGEDELIGATARALAEGKAVGWFQGRMEFGPRALGARSILGDPRSPRMQATMNLKIKFREKFRPFAPSILRERVSEFFEPGEDSPFMERVLPVREEKRPIIPAVAPAVTDVKTN